MSAYYWRETRWSLSCARLYEIEIPWWFCLCRGSSLKCVLGPSKADLDPAWRYNLRRFQGGPGPRGSSGSSSMKSSASSDCVRRSVIMPWYRSTMTAFLLFFSLTLSLSPSLRKFRSLNIHIRGFQTEWMPFSIFKVTKTRPKTTNYRQSFDHL